MTGSGLRLKHIGEFDGRQYLVTELVDAGTLKDWGGADKRSWRQVVDLLVGSPMASRPPTLPESSIGISSRRTFDARSDIFSFGVALYEQLAGRRPFAAGTGFEELQRIMDAPPEPLGDEVPFRLRMIVDKALAKDPAERVGESEPDIRCFGPCRSAPRETGGAVESAGLTR